MPYFTPFAKYLGAAGINKKEEVQIIINAYTLAFFNKYLLGIDSDILFKSTESIKIDL